MHFLIIIRYSSNLLNIAYKSHSLVDLTNEKRQSYVTFTRYLTYFGLCIATCVIFQSSTWIASLIGLAVALYITISEYWLHMNPAPKDGPRPLEDFFKD